MTNPPAPPASRAGRLEQIIAEMRSERPRYKSHDLGFVDSVSASRVDEWADELEACLREEPSAPSQRNCEQWPCTFSHHTHANRDEAVECALQRTIRDGYPRTSDYVRYAASQLASALAKSEDAPASADAHERSALLALQLERIPTLQEWNASWVGEGPSAAPAVHPDALRECGGWLDIGPYCGRCERCKREGHAGASAVPAPPLTSEKEKD